MPDTERVELKHGNQRPRVYKDLTHYGFSERWLKFEEIYNLVEPKLENEEQKNAVKAVLNAFGDMEWYNETREFSTLIGSDVIKCLGDLYNGNLNASQAMGRLKNRIEISKKGKAHQDRYTPNLDIALDNIYKARGIDRTNNPGKLEESEKTDKIVKESISLETLQKKEEKTSGSVNGGEGSAQKKDENSLKTADVSEASAQKKDENSLKTADVSEASAQKKEEHSPWTPDVDEGSVRFFKVTVKEANDVRGRWNDSPEYMNFYNTFRSAGEMMAVLYAAKQHGYNSVAMDPKKLSDNTRSILQGYNSEGKIKISTAKLTQVYKNTYGNIAKYAKVYEDYKHKTKSPNEYNANDVGKLNVTRLFTDSPEVSMPSKGKKRSL